MLFLTMESSRCSYSPNSDFGKPFESGMSGLKLGIKVPEYRRYIVTGAH